MTNKNYDKNNPYRARNPVKLFCIEGFPINSFDVQEDLDDETLSDKNRIRLIALAMTYWPHDPFYLHQGAKFLLKHGHHHHAYKILKNSETIDRFILGLLIPLSLNFGRVDEANELADQLKGVVQDNPTPTDYGLMIQARLAAGRVEEANELADRKWRLIQDNPTPTDYGLMIQARLAAGRVEEAKTLLVNNVLKFDNIYKGLFEAKIHFFQGEWQPAQQKLVRFFQGVSINPSIIKPTLGGVF